MDETPKNESDNPQEMLNGESAAVPDPAPDPFDPASLRLSGDAMAGLGVKKALLTVPVRKPDRAWWVRVHPDPSYQITVGIIELKEDRDGVYLVSPHLRPMLATEATFRPVALFTGINRQAVTFIWPVKLPGTDGRADEWGRSALEAADRATRGWIRTTANMSLGAYEVWEATGEIPDPEWPAQSFRDLLSIAFKDRFIDRPEHPILRKLRGEI